MACHMQLLCMADVENYASGRMKQENSYLNIFAHLQHQAFLNT